VQTLFQARDQETISFETEERDTLKLGTTKLRMNDTSLWMKLGWMVSLATTVGIHEHGAMGLMGAWGDGERIRDEPKQPSGQLFPVAP